MSKTDDWMPLRLQIWRSGTAFMMPEARGPYLDLILAYWELGPLPNDDSVLQSNARVADPKLWRRIRAQIISKFIERDGVLYHERCDTERAIAAQMYERKSKAGQAGGRASAEAKAKRKSTSASNVLEANDQANGNTKNQEQSPNGDSHPSGVSARAKPTKGTRLAADWKPSEEIFAHGAALNLTTDEITGLCRAFFEHFHDNPDCAKPVKRDWNRACKRWITTDAPRVIANRTRAGRASAGQRGAGSVLSALGKILDASDGNAGGMGETFARQEIQPGAAETAHTTGDGPENSAEFGGGDVIDGEWDRVPETSGGIEIPHPSEGGTHRRYRRSDRDLCTADREIPGRCMEVCADEPAGSQSMVPSLAGTEGASGSVCKSAASASEASDDLTLPTFLDRHRNPRAREGVA